MRISDWSSDVCSSDLFVGTMHFGLDDVDGARARVALFFQIVDGDQRCEDGIEDAFGYFIARFVEDGRIGHPVADVADEHQRAAMQRLRLTIQVNVLAVGIQRAGEGLASLADLFRSEEHTSELQSQMRNPYAVLRLT